MKSFRTITFLSIVLTLAFVSSLFAQSDSIVVTPNRGSSDLCGFKMTVKNRNAAQTAIYKIKLEMLSGDGTLFTDAQAPIVPSGWVSGYDQNTSLIDTFQAQVNPIAAGATLGGFRFAYYNDPDHEYDVAKSIKWTTYDNADNQISTGTIAPICLAFQYFAVYDTATVITELSGCDPLFHFTVGNRNDLSRPIGYLQFQLASVTSGTIRPSKCVAPPNWVLDSVNVLSAYFHTDANTIDPGTGRGGFTVALRGNPNATKHNFVWWASDDQDFLIDRDTIFNIPIQATCANADADSVTADAGTNGCLYTLTLRNWHVSNTTPPGAITKLVLRSLTSGVHFDAAPSAPPKWTKTVTADSIVYAADSAKHGVAGGVISSAFSYSVTGPTTSPFNIGWTTYRPQGTISSGTINSTCKVQAPRGDSLTVDAGANQCDFVAHVINLHNTPASNIASITLTIPSGTGQLVGIGSSSGWNFQNVSSTQLKFTAVGGSQTTGSTQDLNFTLKPKTPGAQLVLTCQTFDESNASIWSGTANISCTPPAAPCDTATESVINPDSCWHGFTVISRGGADIISVSFAPTQKWVVDSILSKPNGWDGSIDANGVANLTSSTGVLSGENQAGFNFGFYGKNTTDTFTVNVTTTDRVGRVCVAPIALHCSAGADTGAVRGPSTSDPYISNISIVPNPTRSGSDLSFTLGTQERVFVTVYDELGKTVKVATNMIYGSGTYTVALDLGQQPAGNYYIRIQTAYGLVTKRLVKE